MLHVGDEVKWDLLIFLSFNCVDDDGEILRRKGCLAQKG